MPLLRKKTYSFSLEPSNAELLSLDPSREVFQIPFTKEIFLSYEDYLKKVDLYDSKEWASKSNPGKSDLTLEEALNLEARAKEEAEKFPVIFRRKALEVANNFVGRIDTLVDSVYEFFRNYFIVGEIVHVSFMNNKSCKGEILEEVVKTVAVKDLSIYSGDFSSSELSCKVKLLEENEMYNAVDNVCYVNTEQISRPRNTIAKSAIKSFLKDSLEKVLSSNTFHLKPEVASEFQFEEILQESQICAPETPGKSLLSERGSRKKAIPIDDEKLLTSQGSLGIPNPCFAFAFPSEFAGSIISIWLFLFQFGQILNLYPFPFDDLEISISRENELDSLFTSIICSLLQFVGKERRKQGVGLILKISMEIRSDHLIEVLPYSGNIFQKERSWFEREVTMDNWHAILCGLLQEIQRNTPVRKYSGLISDLSDISRSLSLTIPIRVDLLSFLINCIENGESLHEFIDNEIDEYVEARRSLRDSEYEKRKIAREKKELERKEGILEDSQSIGEGQDEDDSSMTQEGVSEEIQGLELKLRKSSSRVERMNLLKIMKEKNDEIERLRREKVKEDKAQFDEKGISRKINQLRKDIRMHNSFRTKPLGRDRNYTRYWYLDSFYSPSVSYGCGRILVETQGKWGFYSSPEEIKHLLDSLDVRGIREQALKLALQKIEQELYPMMKARHSHLLHVYSFNAEENRRSKRIKSSNTKYSSASTGSNAILEAGQYINQWKTTK